MDTLYSARTEKYRNWKATAMPDDAIAPTQVDATELRAVIGEPIPEIAEKEMPALDEHCRHFISLSPFLCLGTSGADGRHDVSPRGDPPGFVQVLDDKTLLIPERPGNRRADSMSNILVNPSVGIIFFLPGVDETLRVNGRASVVRDAERLAAMVVNGKVPKLAIRIDIDQVFFHCAKALKRSKLWHPDTPIERTDFPSYGRIVRDQRRPDEAVGDVEDLIEKNYREELY